MTQKQQQQRNYQQLHQISTATLLEESSHLRIVMQGIIVTAVLILALIVWAAFSTIQETAVTYGEIIPKGQIQIIQHLEGGIVSKVYVSNGDTVKKGQLLIEMDTASAQAELSQLRGRDITLTLDEERLRAFLDNKQANLVRWSDEVIKSKYNTVNNQEQIASLLKDEKTHLASQLKAYGNQKLILQTALEKSEERLNEVKSQILVRTRHVELLTEEFEMYKKLKKSDYISHRDYLVVLRDLNSAKGEQTSLISQKEQTLKEIEEAHYKLKELASSSREAGLKELGTINDTLLETRHKIEKLEGRVARARITASITGIIKGVAVFGGNVVQPGAQLLEVVPLSKIMLVETRVNPRDIGHIHVGDVVKIKILTFDFARYGAITGKLARISAATFTDSDNKPYYKAIIHLDKQYIGGDKTKKRLKPGMTVQADIVTGDKTILQYLLKPIHRARDAAFTER